MRYFAIALLLALLAPAGADTVLSRVNEALEAGEITVDQAVEYLVSSMNVERELPVWLTQDTSPDPCGTATMDRIAELYSSCSAPVKGELQDLVLARPPLSGPEYTYDSPGGNFKMHWTDQGVDATNESYVQELALAFDWSWEHQCDDMGYEEPPSDLGLGGDERYDVYMISLGGGTIGYCAHAGEPTTGNYVNSSASHIAMESDSSNFGMEQMRETASHEFQHAVQNAYAACEPSWFKENCAVWIQNECWDTNHYADYLHTGDDNCLQDPWKAMDSGPMYHYGASPWPMYMEVRCGTYDVVKQVWYNAAIVEGMNTWDAIETTAGEYGMTMNQWFADYAAWRWFTGDYAVPEGFYEYCESALWTPGPKILPWHNVSSLPASGDQGDYSDYYPEYTGMHWINVDVADYQDGWIDFSFDGRDNFTWIVGYIQYTDGEGAYGWSYIDNQQATWDVSVSPLGWDEVIFFVFASNSGTMDHLYEYEIDFQTGVEQGETSGSGLSVVPSANPMSPGAAITVTTPEAGFTTLNVYDLSGRMVEGITASQLPAGSHTFQWNAADLQPGTYFLRLTGPSGGVSTKVSLQR